MNARTHLVTNISPTPGLVVPEELTGWFGLGQWNGDFTAGRDEGRAHGSALDLRLTLTYTDVNRLLADASSPAHITGEVRAPKLSPRPLTVEHGTFRLFVPEPSHVQTWHMTYDMMLLAEDGNTFELQGTKIIHNDDAGLDAWADTTTLLVQVKHDGQEIGSGIVRISPEGLLRSIASIQITGVHSARRRAMYHARYLAMWAGHIVHVYGGSLDEDGRFWGTAKDLDLDPERVITIRGNNGTREPDTVLWIDRNHKWHESRTLGNDAWLRLTRFHGGDKGPVLVAPGFAMGARSFALETNSSPNFTEYLVSQGFDVWLFDYRASIDLPSARTNFTLDDIAQQDWFKAVDQVREYTQQPDVQIVAHCAGTATLLMAMAEGLTGVRSAVLSQFTIHPTTLGFIRFKTALRVPTVLRWMGFKTVSPDARPTLRARVFDSLFAIWPVPRGERCGRAACRWINLMFGMTHRHDNLDDATHNAMVTAFGVGDLHAMEHLGVMLTKQLAVDAQGHNRYVHHAPTFNLPLHFIVGNRNHLFLPDSTGRTLQFLEEDGRQSGTYTSKLYPKYAHLDLFVGRDAATDVFPDVRDVLNRYPSATSGQGRATQPPAAHQAASVTFVDLTVTEIHEEFIEVEVPTPPTESPTGR
jgi:cholesterol oxidase